MAKMRKNVRMPSRFPCLFCLLRYVDVDVQHNYPHAHPDAPLLTQQEGKSDPAKGSKYRKVALLLRFALFAYLLGMTVLITLLPFRFQWPTRVHILATAGLFDVVTNISLFLPLGFCYRLVRHDQHDRWGRTLGFGMLLSSALNQRRCSRRYSSVMDIAANSHALGWGPAQSDHTTINERFVGQLALELPPMQLFYLLVPLLRLNVLRRERWRTPVVDAAARPLWQ
jgi:hypothetical protein